MLRRAVLRMVDLRPFVPEWASDRVKERASALPRRGDVRTILRRVAHHIGKRVFAPNPDAAFKSFGMLDIAACGGASLVLLGRCALYRRCAFAVGQNYPLERRPGDRLDYWAPSRPVDNLERSRHV